MQDGVPHGIAEWGIAKAKECPSALADSILIFIGKGKFENGKPVGEHEIRTHESTMIYTYEAGRLKEAHEKDGRFQIYFKDNNSPDEVLAMPFDYYPWIGLRYTGKVDKNRKPHDTQGLISMDKNKTVKVHFEHGVLQKGARASFTYNDVILTAPVNEKLHLHGKATIQGNAKADQYSGYVYLRDGEADPAKESYLQFDQFKLSNNLSGKLEVRGNIKMNDFAEGYFEGEDLVFSFARDPNTRFRGNLKRSGQGVNVSGWHTVTEYKNGLVQRSLKGRYAPNGSFVNGDNIYQKETTVIYDRSPMTDPRDGKTYQTITYKVKENGEYKLLTWMLEDLNYEPLADEKSKVRGWDLYIMYYSQDKAKRACPRGWRLPYSSDYNIIPIDPSIKDSQKKNIARIRKLDLDRNGYIYRMFGKYEGELRREGKEVHYWLQNDYELSISEINFGSSLKVKNNYSYFTCRCVKEEKL